MDTQKKDKNKIRSMPWISLAQKKLQVEIFKNKGIERFII